MSKEEPEDWWKMPEGGKAFEELEVNPTLDICCRLSEEVNSEPRRVAGRAWETVDELFDVMWCGSLNVQRRLEEICRPDDRGAKNSRTEKDELKTFIEMRNEEQPNDPSSAAPEQWRGSCRWKTHGGWS